jgi:ATP-dependent helicase Lhr and Lhr-like helicase
LKQKNEIAERWFTGNNWEPYDFQQDTWRAIAGGYSGVLNAPTGYGKTFAIWFGVLQHYYAQKEKPKKSLHCLWITPLRALSKEILKATQRVSNELKLDYTIGLRTGDTTLSERAKQKRSMPHAMITTPESMHLMLGHKDYQETFRNLEFVVVDEWHELLGSKRGVLIELALSRLKTINPRLKIWGVSATIGNLKEAMNILLGPGESKRKLIRTKLDKQIIVETILPDVIEKFPWAGHLGIKLIDKVLPIIYASRSVLLFTNTRSQAEIWYQRLLERDPGLAGRIALHHGSLGENIRQWVENALHEEKLKAVVCTSSLDLGVDFRPVDTVVQIGSAKGIARFMQRAGRSGHQPGMPSKIYFLPTHSLEIIEGSALRYAIKHNLVEQRTPYIRSFDVLVQYLVTLAVSDGFRPQEIFDEVKRTHCFASMSEDEFGWCLAFITRGGKSLDAYDQFHKVVVENGVYKVTSKSIAMRHRLSIGTIVSDSMMQVKYMRGTRIGLIEEWFISRMKPGDVFWFGGKPLELARVKDMEVFVRRSKKEKGLMPSWQGGRMPLSSQLSGTIRNKLDEFYSRKKKDAEMEKMEPLFIEQQLRSHMPKADELLVEKIFSRDGCHVFIYPFEGRNVHEGLSALFAYRIAKERNITFSLGYNDYGIEMLSDQDIPIEAALKHGLFDTTNIGEDIRRSVNITEMARRRFRDIAGIAGLTFSGYPGKQTKTRHLQATSQLFFSVFLEHEKDNLLLQQAYDEVLIFQMEQQRLVDAMQRMQKQKLKIYYPEKLTPFCFPILTDRFREKLSTEKLEDRIRKLIEQQTR